MSKAFLFVEAALSEELARPFNRTITEEYVRIALMHGLMASEPTEAYRVYREHPVSWSGALCASHHAPIKESGRPLSCDVYITPDTNEAPNSGLICEIKWLKNGKRGPINYAQPIIQDLWKLTLTRGITQERSATRTYILIGGDAKSFSITFKELQRLGANLRWSPVGRTKNRKPKPHEVKFGSRFSAFFNPLDTLIKRGHHRRLPPPCWWTMRVSLRNRWFRTLSKTTGGWRVALWELDHYGMKEKLKFDWDLAAKRQTIRCQISSTRSTGRG